MTHTPWKKKQPIDMLLNNRGHLRLIIHHEISRVRKDMYNDTLNGSTEKRSSELPDAVGATVQLQEKLYVPVKEYPDVAALVSGMHQVQCTATLQMGHFKYKPKDKAMLIPMSTPRLKRG
ncbi:UNVERIFIED_CONTAM: hypothetical protein FKN15_030623 [Acipenser sinensis]